MRVEKKSKFSDSALATAEKLKKQSVAAILEDADLSSGSVCAASTSQQALGLGGVESIHGAAAAARPTPRGTKPGPAPPAEPEEFPLLRKAIKNISDPVVAATKLRKATLKDFCSLETKMNKALGTCRDTMNLIADDFDCEERLFAD